MDLTQRIARLNRDGDQRAVRLRACDGPDLATRRPAWLEPNKVDNQYQARFKLH